MDLIRRCCVISHFGRSIINSASKSHFIIGRAPKDLYANRRRCSSFLDDGTRLCSSQLPSADEVLSQLRRTSAVYSVRTFCQTASLSQNPTSTVSNELQITNDGNTGDDNKTFACPHCYVAYNSQWSLDRHITRKHLAKTFSCDICSHKFYYKRSVYLHKAKVHLQRHICDACCFVADSPKHLQFHKERQHSDSVPFSCFRCHLNFASEEDLANHQALAHLYRKAAYACRHCSRSFKYAYDLKEHLAFHDREDATGRAFVRVF